MTDSQKLHTAARRYCMERHYHWARLYSQMPYNFSSGYSPEQLAVFPRYILLEAIQVEVERFDFEKLVSISELRELLILAAQIATPSGGGAKQEIARKAEQETRSEFVRFIEDFDANCVVEPLPYRRALFGDEFESVLQMMLTQWSATRSFYFPLHEAESSYAPTLLAYNSKDFYAAIPEEKLAKVLRAHGITRIYEVRESGQENYLQDIELINPFYSGDEVFISSEKWDWLFYASHESSVTTGGWLTKAIQDEWPEWEAAIFSW